MENSDVVANGGDAKSEDRDLHDSGCEQSPTTLSPATSENKAAEIRVYNRVIFTFPFIDILITCLVPYSFSYLFDYL